MGQVGEVGLQHPPPPTHTHTQTHTRTHTPISEANVFFLRNIGVDKREGVHEKTTKMT